MPLFMGMIYVLIAGGAYLEAREGKNLPAFAALVLALSWPIGFGIAIVKTSVREDK